MTNFAGNLRDSFTTSIRNLFVPNEANDGTPQILSGIGTGAYLLVALVLIFAPQIVRIRQLASLTEPFGFTSSQMIALTNQARLAEGLPALTQNPVLSAAAQAKASDMFAKQYFAHVAPDGATPWSFFAAAGYKYRAAGENLASDFVRPEDAQAAFMASPSHRANIMNPLYTEIGIAVGQGLLGGHANIVIAEYFGTPKSTPAVAAAPTVTPSPTPTPVPTPKPTPIPIPKPAPVPTQPTTTSPATTSVAGANRTSTIANVGPEVLGTASGAATTQPASRFTRMARNLKSFSDRIPEYMKLKVLALILTATLAIAIAFFIARAEHLTPHILVRAFVVLIILGYAGTVGVKNWQTTHLTPTSFATISAIEVQ